MQWRNRAEFVGYEVLSICGCHCIPINLFVECLMTPSVSGTVQRLLIC